jgi:hypothetical protein
MCTKIKIFWKENFVFSAVLFFLSFTVRWWFSQSF